MTEDIGNASKRWVEEVISDYEGVVNGDISTIGNTLTMDITEIVARLIVKSTSATSCNLNYPISSDIPLIDIRRCIWGEILESPPINQK